MRGRTGEVVETLSRRKVGVCCVQEERWRGVSARLITGTNNEYKMYWVGNTLGLFGVGILVAGKWIDKIFDVKRVNGRLMMIKLLILKRIVAIVSVYALQQGLAEDVKDKFYEDLISLVSKVEENELVILVVTSTDMLERM